MKRTPLRRHTRLVRTSAARKKKRKPSEFARIYHSKARVAWVKSQPCDWCGVAGYSENAHTENDGMGRKAGYATIVALCGPNPYRHDASAIYCGCHRLFDERRAPFNSSAVREILRQYARRTEDRWQAHCAHRDAK